MESSMFSLMPNNAQHEGRHNSPLLTANVEEDEDDHDYNDRNDETFGLAVEEDWESDHEKLAASLIGGIPENREYCSTDEQYHSNVTTDDIVKSSIKHLVLDDDLDNPAILGHSSKILSQEYGRSIFNQSPPPPALINSDITGSPITGGIWSSPQRRDSSPLTSNLVDFSIPTQPKQPFKKFSSMKLPPVKILPNVKTVEELEKDMFKAPEPRNSGVMTLEDVERDLFLKPRAKTVSEIENELRKAPPTPGGIDLPSMPAPQFPSQLPIGTPQSGQLNQAQQQAINAMLNNQKNMNSSNQSRPGVMHPPVANPIILPGYGVRVPHNSHHMTPTGQNFKRYPMIYPPVANSINQINMSRMPLPPNHRFPNNMVMPVHHGMQHGNRGYNGIPFNHIGANNRYQEQPENFDPYAGLMTHKEKDWLVKIQMMQLQSDNPYIDDYYYTAYKLKKMLKSSQNVDKLTNNESGPKLVLPERGKVEVKEYKPAQFQGSLGKIHAASVNNPRKMIDIVDNKSEDDDEDAKRVANRELRRYRKGLIDVEKLYDILLDIDDLDKKILALPPEAQVDHQVEQKKLILELFNEIISADRSDKFTFMILIRKGKRLIIRLFPLLEKSQQIQFLEKLLRNLGTALKRDQVDLILTEFFYDVEKCISNCNFNELLLLSGCIEFQPSDGSSKSKLNPALLAIQSKFGISMLLSMFERAEKVIEDNEIIPESKSKWSVFVNMFCKLLMNTTDNAIATPLMKFSNLWSHFQRFVSDTSSQQHLLPKLSNFIIDKSSKCEQL